MLNKKKTTRFKSDEKVVTPSVPKRIGFFSAVIMTIGGCIGSGIFFKSGTVMNYNNNSIVLSVISWIIAGFSVILMAIALIDIASQSKKDNRGFLSWIRKFNSMMVYKMAKNYFLYFYVPTNWFMIPVYLFQSLQSGLAYLDASYVNGELVYGQVGLNVLNFPWWGAMLILIGLCLWFALVSGFSIKIGNATNLIVNGLKFIPLVFAILIGFIIIGVNSGKLPAGNVVNYVPINTHIKGPENLQYPSFFQFSPILGIFMAMSAIFFAYDGFYVASGMGDKLKEPKKIPWILLTGLLIVTGIYLAISLGITLGSPQGQWDKIGIFFVKHKVTWIYVLINIIISVGIFSSLNGYGMWGPHLYQTFIESREALFAKYLRKYLNKFKRPVIGIFYQIAFGLPTSVICFLIGVYAYKMTGSYTLYTTNGATNYAISHLYNFCDLISNWQTIIAFLFISCSIMSYSFKSMKTPKKTTKQIISMIAAFISSTAIFLAMIAQIISPVVNLSIQCHVYFMYHLDTNSAVYSGIVSNVCLLAILFGIFILCTVPSLFEKYNKHLKKIYEQELKLMHLEIALHELVLEKERLSENKVIETIKSKFSLLKKKTKKTPVITGN